MPEDSVHDLPLRMNDYDDDESTLESEICDYSLDLEMDDDSSSSSQSSDFGFVLDIGLLERSRYHEPSRSFPGFDDSQILETDSLKLIRKRGFSQRPKDCLLEVRSSSSPHVISFKKMGSTSSYAEVCEVPLGVSLKDILPSSLCSRSSPQPNFSQLVRDSNRSESLLEDIDKALEILSADAM